MAALTKAQIAALLTNATLRTIAPNISTVIRDALRTDAPSAFSDAKVNTIVRIAHFFAQILKETGGLRRLDENLNYTTAERIREVWPSRFPTITSAQPYVREPEKLANFVYANRNGNGNVASGDGWRYRGSGLIQLTGRGNFKTVGELIGVGNDLVNSPDRVRTPRDAVAIAVGYWTARQINEVADGQTHAAVDQVTARVNPYEGAAGKRERRANFDHARSVLTQAMPSEASGLAAAAPTLVAVESAEISTEPTAFELLADRLLDLRHADREIGALVVPPVYWPSDDANAPDYYHLLGLETDPDAAGDFAITAEDIEVLAEANSFEIPTDIKTVALAFRGAILGAQYEQVNQTSIPCIDTRPDHTNFRCVLGFWYRTTGKITLFAGSTVPAPYYMKNYYFKENGLPYYSSIDCNMLPSGHYVFRVGSHAGGSIRPALRMSEPDDIQQDARVCVWRTSNDLTYGLVDLLDAPSRVYDNVHCSYFLNQSSTYGAAFSSAGCLTVRGRKDPSDQWAKYQRELNRVGNGKRADMLFLTGKEAAIASQRRQAGMPRTEIVGALARLRIGSSGSRVGGLQARLGIGQSGYFDPATQQALYRWQRHNGKRTDAIYSPALDADTGWSVF